MKKIFVLAIVLLSTIGFSQKKKKVATPAIVPIVLVKSGNDSAEIIKNNLYLFVANGAKKDTMLLKTYTVKGNPTLCSIKKYTAKGTPLYYVTWSEVTVEETKLKKEETTAIESQIWDPATKTLVIGNTSAVTKIRETVFLDKLKNASETQERIRRSGYELILLGEDFLLKDKSSETKYTFNVTTMKYEVYKAPVAAKPVPTKKKRR
jgi:hypothetical protein